THGLAHLPRSVRLAVHRVEDLAAGGGRRDDPTTRVDARSRHQFGVDGCPQSEDLVVVRPDVANRREPGSEDAVSGRGEDVMRQPRRSARFAVLCRWRPEARAAARIRRDMDVRVDQPREDRGTGEIMRPLGRLADGVPDRGYRVALEGDRLVLGRRARSWIEPSYVPEDLAHVTFSARVGSPRIWPSARSNPRRASSGGCRGNGCSALASSR